MKKYLSIMVIACAALFFLSASSWGDDPPGRDSGSLTVKADVTGPELVPAAVEDGSAAVYLHSPDGVVLVSAGKISDQTLTAHNKGKVYFNDSALPKPPDLQRLAGVDKRDADNCNQCHTGLTVASDTEGLHPPGRDVLLC